MHKIDSQGSQEPEQQKVAEISVDDTTERLFEKQIEVAIDPAKESRGLVGDPARNPTIDPVKGHRRQLTESVQLQLY